LDYRLKADVLELSLSSMKGLPISKVILNVECNEEYSRFKPRILEHAKGCFPNAVVVQEADRPTNLAAWHRSTSFAEEFFGDSLPIICSWNHDHIFVDYRIDPFVKTLSEAFASDGESPLYFYYSHTPEIVSGLYDFERQRTTPVGRKAANGLSAYKRISPTVFEFMREGMIEGIFVTTSAGLRGMWSRAVVAGEYLPRPDWSGIRFPGMKFRIRACSREFFRHFDGYGHVTSLCGGLTLDLGGFTSRQPRARCHLPEVFGGSFSDMARTDTATLALSYSTLFSEICSLAARNAILPTIFSGHPTRAGKHVLEDLFGLFSDAYLDYEGELDLLTAEALDDLKTMVSHKVFADAGIFFQQLLGDCHYYHGALPGAPPPRSPSLPQRAIGATKRLLRPAKHLWRRLLTR
jgi:hypothetical protein